ncbi:dermokine-like isoform X4 [Sagmatias obliquidens]|uniref:dermokine-like isoform X4 n=1 Tax=Sagmatias obliquidens TaxID=3371155 RepID=UPI000F442FCA|nr:dermokine-like isoform X4 [Lagenorhynchus obliquidens]
MKLQGCLACLLLALCLGSGEAGLLLSGGESSGAGAMETTGHGVGEAIGQEVGEAIKHGVGEATGGGDGEAAGSGVKETMGPGVGDALARGVEEAAHALGNTGSEAGRQAENVIQHGVDAAHSSSQGMPGGNGALAAVAQPPYGSRRSSDNPNAEGSSNDGRNSGGSISGGSSGGSNSSSGGSSELHWNSQLFPGLFGLDTFWKNLKSKLGFMNWDTISKNQIPDLRTRIFLYFCRLWEKFKQSTPFLNWKAITENYDYNQQKYPTASGGQHSAQIPTKCGVTVSSSASRARPDLLQWVKFW